MDYRRQHVISRVILRRFAVGANKAARVAVFNLETGNERLSSPNSVGYINSFVSHEPEVIEAVWSEVERNAPQALESVDNGGPLNPATIETLKRLVALHFLRRNLTKQVFGEIYALRKEERLAEYRTGPARIASIAQAVLGREPLNQDDWDRVATSLGEKFDTVVEEIFHEQLTDMYRRAEADVQNKGLLIVRTRSSEFSLNDQAVLSLNETGPQARAQLFGPADHFLPVGPNLGLVLGVANGEGELTADEVDAINRIQVVTADRFLYYRPGSDLSAIFATLPNRPPLP